MQRLSGSGCVLPHVHELLGSVKLADYVCPAHNHRVATITGQAVAQRNGEHVHEIRFLTDSFEGHHHEYAGTTGNAICICGGHIHYAEGMLSCAHNHRHCFTLTTLIADPISE